MHIDVEFPLHLQPVHAHMLIPRLKERVLHFYLQIKTFLSGVILLKSNKLEVDFHVAD